MRLTIHNDAKGKNNSFEARAGQCVGFGVDEDEAIGDLRVAIGMYVTRLLATLSEKPVYVDCCGVPI